MNTLRFDNRFIEKLPGDPDQSNRRRQVLGAAWSTVMPTPVSSPRLLAVVHDLTDTLGFSVEHTASQDFAEVFGGNALLPGMRPWATCYGGHQFGQWAGQLGDGRAISLGEVVNAAGERRELQLKGAGPTPYSRNGDGRAVLRSSIREFLCSEAMHHLGIPTTRALSLVTTGEDVLRDMFYDGHPATEPGAIVCRVAPSFTRFGNFEIFSARSDFELLEQLVEFTIARDFPHIAGGSAARRSTWFCEVCERTARLMAHWMRVGFVHGVMNTDNMSILGLTIDYGPYGWLDEFDPIWTPNTTDADYRRYSYSQQPAVAQWNLMQLANALAPLFPDVTPLQEGLDRYAEVFVAEHEAMRKAKFGFLRQGTDEVALIVEAFELMSEAAIDFTRFFRALSEIPDELDDTPAVTLLGDVFYDADKRATAADAISDWLYRWHKAVRFQQPHLAARRASMHAVNPWFVLRNYIAQEAIDAASHGDPSQINMLLNILKYPYEERPEHARLHNRLGQRRPDWALHKAGCAMLSCSS